jgi:predicted DNA-binding transcriptional regulator AlpA
MLTDEELELGGFRFEELKEKGYVKSRTDLARKQETLGFPRPIKSGEAQALFLKSEVFAWLRKRAALRDAAPVEPAPQVKAPRVHSKIKREVPVEPEPKRKPARRAS